MHRGSTSAQEFRPRLLEPQVPSDLRVIDSYLAEPCTLLVDAYAAQIRDLIKTRSPRDELDERQLAERVKAELAGRSEKEHGTWVYYPWSRRLVHLLAREDFQELRSNRNQHKILAADQRRLRTACIGIVGLSVGHSAAMTLVLEGIGGRFRLADFDVLDLSNLNRIRTGVHNLGINKAVLAAREMYELDPYLDIQILTDGVTAENLDAFFEGDAPLHLLVEECDDLFVKVRLRERARELGIPVLMDTSDGGLLDIERFDLEPGRPLFHGVIPDLRAQELVGLTTKEKIPFVLAILGIDQMTTEFAGSLVEVKKTLATWPQLGSSVTLGGALVAHAARSVLLDTMRCSGRFSIDLGALIAEGRSTLPSAAPTKRPLPEECAALPRPPARPATSELDRSLIEYFLKYAIRAPSGGNSQPWKFRWSQDVLRCTIDGSRSSFLDFNYEASALAMGAAFENIAMAAQSVGYRMQIEPVRDQLPHACELRFEACQRTEPELLPFVFQRASNRHLGDGSLLSEAEAAALHSGLQGSAGDVHVLRARETIDRVGSLLGAVDRLRFLSPMMHAELISELRWTSSEVLSTRDGIDLATLEMSDADRAVLRVLARPDVMRFLAAIGEGVALGEPAEKGCAHASGLALLTVPRDSGDMLEAGRLMQRLWLRATQLGLAVCPQGVIFFLLARVEAGDRKGLSDSEVEAIIRIGQEMRIILNVPAGRREVMLFRLSRAPAPSAFALRLGLGDVLEA